MITFILLLGLLAFVLTFLAAVGAGFVVVFGDLLVCIGLIVLIVKLFSKKDESRN